jgi:hypothetical protein
MVGGLRRGGRKWGMLGEWESQEMCRVGEGG